jgi:hypothetical protein
MKMLLVMMMMMMRMMMRRMRRMRRSRRDRRKTDIDSSTIAGHEYQLYNITVNKPGLSPFDEKRYILDDGINSLAYGHWRI